MEAPYRRDLSHTTWDEVFARQAKRADLVVEWMTDLDMKPGARVLDIGAGPGYVSLVLADRVGAEGVVYAVDRSAEALAYLERLQHERGIGQIQRIVAEFDPDGPCAFGPPQAERVASDQVRAWCEAAGFSIISFRQQTPEHYRFIVCRHPEACGPPHR